MARRQAETKSRRLERRRRVSVAEVTASLPLYSPFFVPPAARFIIILSFLFVLFIPSICVCERVALYPSAIHIVSVNKHVELFVVCVDWTGLLNIPTPFALKTTPFFFFVFFFFLLPFTRIFMHTSFVFHVLNMHFQRATTQKQRTCLCVWWFQPSPTTVTLAQFSRHFV